MWKSLVLYDSGGVAKPAVETRTPALAALSAGADRLATEGSVADALRAVAEAARAASNADLAILRVVEHGLLATRGVAGPPFLIAEIVGSRMAEAPPEAEIDELERLPEPLQAIAARTSATAVFVVPVRHDGRVAGSLELYRVGDGFDEAERAAARLTAAQAALALRVFEAERVRSEVPAAIGLAAEALGAGADEARTAERIARLAADATGAPGCVLWRAVDEELELACATGTVDPEASREAATAALRGHGQTVEEAGDLVAVSLPLGQPAFGVLQLLYRERPAEADLALLGAFAGRAAQALRTGERAGEVRRELERTRDLLSVVGQATAQLSLSHTLETAIARVPELLEVQAAAVYLRDGGRLETAASRDVAGPHAVVAARLLDLALGPFRARGIVASDDAAHDRRLASVRAAATEAGIEAAHAVPLVAHGDVIGLFAVYPPLGRELTVRPVGPARGARRPDRGRSSERAVARGDEAARHGA